MKQRKKNIKLRLVSLLFISLVGGIVFNSAFFLHSHRTACGKIVVHAHPFNKSAENNNPFSKHQHNKIDLTALGALDFYFNNQLVIQISVYPEIETEIDFSNNHLLFSTLSFLYPNRAPPVNSAS